MKEGREEGRKERELRWIDGESQGIQYSKLAKLDGYKVTSSRKVVLSGRGDKKQEEETRDKSM